MSSSWLAGCIRRRLPAATGTGSCVPAGVAGGSPDRSAEAAGPVLLARVEGPAGLGVLPQHVRRPDVHRDDRGLPFPARHGNRPGAVPGDPEDHRARCRSVAPVRSRGTVDHRGHRDPQGVPAADRRSGQVTTITATPAASSVPRARASRVARAAPCSLRPAPPARHKRRRPRCPGGSACPAYGCASCSAQAGTGGYSRIPARNSGLAAVGTGAAGPAGGQVDEAGLHERASLCGPRTAATGWSAG